MLAIIILQQHKSHIPKDIKWLPQVYTAGSKENATTQVSFPTLIPSWHMYYVG